MSSKQVYLVALLGKVHFKVKEKTHTYRKKNNSKKYNKKNPPSSPSAPRDPLHSCFSHQRLPDKWVHQREHWDMVPWMGHVARARRSDTLSCACISIHGRGRAGGRACAIWLCANVSFCLFMGCDNVDGCHCHLWLPPRQMGADSDRRRKVSGISPLDRRGGLAGEWRTCAPHNFPRQDARGSARRAQFQFKLLRWLVGELNLLYSIVEGQWSKCCSLSPSGSSYTNHW